MIGIYKITSPTGRVYIGQSVDIEDRHRKYRTCKCSNQPKIYNSIKKHGWNKHIFEIIEECAVEDLNSRERYWQDYYDVIGDKGLNCTLTATETKSGKASIETILKRSGKNNCMFGIKGEAHPLYNVPRPQEVRDRISQSQSGEKGYWFGKKQNAETTNKRVQKMIGVPQTQEHIEKRIEIKNQKYILLNTQTGIYYFGYENAAESLSMEKKVFWQILNRNKRNTTPFILV